MGEISAHFWGQTVSQALNYRLYGEEARGKCGKSSKLSERFHPSFPNREEAPTSQVTARTHPHLRAVTYGAGAMDDGTGATAGGGAGAGAQGRVFLRVLAVRAGLVCLLLVLQLINRHLAGIPQRRVCQRVHICQNPRRICLVDSLCRPVEAIDVNQLHSN